MDVTLKLFLIGMTVGLIIIFIPDSEDINENSSNQILRTMFWGGVTIWKIIYFSILLISLPFMAIEPLKKRLTIKQFLPFPFIAGNSVTLLLANLILVFVK